MKTKVCGLMNLDDARLAVDLGAWAVGFVFYPKSPRYLSPTRAYRIISRLPSSVRTVGVFVNSTLAEVRRVSKQSGICTAQLHGDESPEEGSLVGLPIFKAFRLNRKAEIAQVSSFVSSCQAIEAVVVDAAVSDPSCSSGLWGGTGKLANWKWAREARQVTKVILAGGLNAQNIRQAIEAVQPDAVDVSSGLEEYPGKKSGKKMEEFFQVVS